MNNFNVPNQDSQKRIKRQSYVIVSEDNELELFQEQKTEMLNNGDIITTDFGYSLIVDGERISRPSEIAGRCQEPNCGKYLTHRKARYCYVCARVNCPDCGKYDDKLGVWLCPTCYKKLKRQRFWKLIKNLIAIFFLKRKDR